MENDLLADSNVYIRLLRVRRDPIRLLHEWSVERDCQLAVCGMIRVEVLRGLRSPKALKSITAFMDAMVSIKSEESLWSEAAQLAWTLDRQGIIIPAPDAVIASSALRIGATVMTSDAHFKYIPGLSVTEPPQEWFSRTEHL